MQRTKLLTFNSTSLYSEFVGGKITLGGRIKELRLAAKLSQRELAGRVAKRLKEDDRRGFDFTYLSKIENNRLGFTPSVPALLALAEELNGDSDELIALAGKVPQDVGELLQKSEPARMFFRSALSSGLSDDEWRKLIEDLQAKKKKK
ncbi:MAG TPA: helix-turn-helix transcriptional regulator [Candidatus Angelobacter sp.]|nr:helix-turn-helix transcriptional regulator [Candidatus Angelobacter sp.]